MSDRIPMTRTGYNKIKAEVEGYENDDMPKIAQRIADARAEGDLKENAEYHGARESQGMLQAKINLLKDKLARADIMDTTNIDKSEVCFGATVKVLDLDIDEEEELTLVGGGEEDYDTGKYLITSPIGQGLVGSKVGDEVKIAVPKGSIKFKILEIRYDD